MAAPRKYSDAQRAAMFALFEQGYTPAEIARKCKLGTASVNRFDIPRRTVQEIVKSMERERGGPLPTNFDQAADPDLIATFPKRILRILNRQLDRYDAKTRNGKNLSAEDLDRLKRVSAICRDLERKNRAYSPTPRGLLTQRATEATLQDLASSIVTPAEQDAAGGNSRSPIVPAEKTTSLGSEAFPDPLKTTIEAATARDADTLELVLQSEREHRNRPEVIAAAEAALNALQVNEPAGVA